MKKYLFTALIFLLAVSPLSPGFAATPKLENPMEQRLFRYAAIGEKAEERCLANVGAGVDSSAGKEYKSACLASYVGAKKVADQYKEDQAKAATRIQELSSTSTALCGANRSPAEQKNCFESAAKNYDEAAKLKGDMATKLLEAHNEALKWRELNLTALKKYREDLRKIEALEREAKQKADVFRAQQEFGAAIQTEKQVQGAPAISASGISVAASSGKAKSIAEYKGKFTQLTSEQTGSQEHATQFAEDTKKEASKLKMQSVNLEQMAADARAKAAALPTGSDPKKEPGISKADPMAGKKVPVPEARPNIEDAAPVKASIGGGESSTADNSGGQPEDQSGGSQTQGNAQANSQGGGGNTSAAGMASVAAPMQGAAASSGVAASDPYAGMNAASSMGSGQAKQQLASANLNEALGTYDPRTKNEETQVLDADADRKDEPAQVATAAGLSGGIDGETSGASSAPGILGADGKPIRTGFSSSAGGSLQSGRQNLDRDAASRDQFSPDLKSGAVSIAGSEMKSAMSSLAEEFGTTDLDLNLGDLTAEEKAALAPLDGSGEGARNTASVKTRQGQGQMQGSEVVIQDEESAALFARTHSAHERALKRGNLIFGIKKKL